MTILTFDSQGTDCMTKSDYEQTFKVNRTDFARSYEFYVKHSI